MKLVSDFVFYWFIIGMLIAIGTGYMSLEIVRLRRYLRSAAADRKPDELFGLVIGILLCAVGLGGVVKHFAGW